MRLSNALLTHLFLLPLLLPIPAHSVSVLHGDTVTDCLEAISRLKACDLDSYRLVLIGGPQYRYLVVFPHAKLVTDDLSKTALLYGRELRIRTSFGEVRTTLRAPAVILGIINLENADVGSDLTVLWRDRIALLTPYSAAFARLEPGGRIELKRVVWFDKYRHTLPPYRPEAYYCEYRFDTRNGTVEVKFYDLWCKVSVRANLNDESATFDEVTVDPETTLREIESRLTSLPEGLWKPWNFLLVRTPEGVEPIAITINPLKLAPGSHLSGFLRILNLMGLCMDSLLSLAPALALTAKLYAAVNGLSVEIRWDRNDPFERLYDEVWFVLPAAACWDLLYPLVSSMVMKSIVERLRPLGLVAIIPCHASVGMWEWMTEGTIFPILERWYWRSMLSALTAPVVEEPFKRLVAAEFGVPRIVSGAVYGLLEGLWKCVTEHLPSSALMVYPVIHVLYTVLPLPLAMELHYLVDSSVGPKTNPWDAMVYLLDLLRDALNRVLTGDVPTILMLLYYSALSIVLENIFGIPITPGL